MTEHMKTLHTYIISALLTASAVTGAGAVNMYPVEIDGMWGYAAPDGHMLVNPVFDNAEDFADGMAAVCIDGRWGYIDENRELAIRPAFDEARPFSEGLASVRLGDRWTIVDRRGVPVSENAFFSEAPATFSGGRASVRVDGAYGFINRRGELTGPAVFKTASAFADGMALVTNRDGDYIFIDADGKTIFRPEGYDYVDSFCDGLATVGKNGHYGYIDTDGKTAIPHTWADARSFSEGVAAVMDNNRLWGFIDRTGKIVLEPTFDHVISTPHESFINYIETSDGSLCTTSVLSMSEDKEVAFVCKGSKWGIFNKRSGRVTVAPAYDWIIDYGDVFGLESQKGKVFATPSGKIFDKYDLACDALAAETSFAGFAKKRIEPAVNAWQRKGRYEKSSDYVARVNNETRRTLIERLAHEAEIDFITRYAPYVILSYRLSDYDADNEVFLITTPRGELLVPVPLADAPEFERRFDSAVKTPAFCIENDRLNLAEVKFTMPDGREYKYMNSASLSFAAADIDYHFEPFVIEKAAVHKGRQNISTVKMTVGKSDVDVDIPSAKEKRPETFAVIIGNENYTKAQRVDYAATDAAVFAEYCRTALGLPDDNVRHYPDATYLNMLDALADIRSIADAYKGNIDIIFYYAGHGLPDDATRTPHLMPVDADGSRLDYCLPTSKLYSELAATGARRITVFMDACFSGTLRGEGMIDEARAVRRRVRADAPQGRMVVFSAATGDETAYPYREKSHGLFTYFLLKKIRENAGTVTLGELADYIIGNVSRQSTVANRRSQTPTVAASAAIADGWREQAL